MRISTTCLVALFTLTLTACSQNSGPPGLPMPSAVQPMSKPYVAKYRDVAESTAVSESTYTSDGNGRLRVDPPNGATKIYDTKMKTEFHVNPVAKTFIKQDVQSFGWNYDFNIPEIVDPYGAQDETPDFDQIGSTSQLMTTKAGTVGRKSTPKELQYVGDEKVNNRLCQHFTGQHVMAIRTDAYYSPELNACVKHATVAQGNTMGGILQSHTATLIDYKDKIDPSVFDLTGYRQVKTWDELRPKK